jgi:archaellum component FlaC
MESESLQRRKIDVLYQDILGEVNDLLIKIDGQKQDVSKATESLKNIVPELENVFTTFHEDTLAVMNQQMVDNLASMQKSIDANLAASIEAAKIDIGQAASNYLTNVCKDITTNIQQALNAGIASSLNEIKLNIESANKDVSVVQNKLIKSLKDAKERTDEIQPTTKWESLIYGLVGGCIGGIAISVAISFGGIHVS